MLEKNDNNITIIGSGINSYYFIKNILKRGAKINLIDFNVNNTQRNLNKKFKSNVSPKIQLKNFQSNVESYKDLNNFDYINFDTQSALSIGGLSNVWGGTVYKFNEKDLWRNNLEKFELSNYIKNVSDDEIFLKKPLYDEYFEKNINKKNYKIKYNFNLVDKNENPINVKNKILDLVTKKKINLIEGFVENIKKNNNHYDIVLIHKNKKVTFRSKKLILAAGTLSTSKILMKLLKIKRKRILCTPLKQDLLFCFRNQNSNNLNSILSFNHKDFKDVTGHIFPLKGLHNDFFTGYLNLNKNLFNPIFGLVKPFFYGIYNYYSSDYSNLNMMMAGDKFNIEGENLTNLNFNLKKFYNFNLIKIPYYKKDVIQGIDNHLGGGFSLNEFFNNLNELKNFPNLHVIDGAYLNYVPPLGYTLITILNSIRIAQKIKI